MLLQTEKLTSSPYSVARSLYRPFPCYTRQSNWVRSTRQQGALLRLELGKGAHSLSCRANALGSSSPVPPRFLQRSSSATTYVFPLPETPPLPTNITAFAPLSYASFVPSNSPSTSQREPGLISISTLGSIRYWESISMALSGVERFKALNAPLSEDELVRGLKMLSPTSYLVSTSQARLILVTISSVGGRVAVNARPLERSVGWAGSVWSAVFGGSRADPRAGVLALALSPTNSAGDGKSWAYAFTEKDVQVWEMPSRDDGGERLAVEQDVFAGVLEALSGEQVTNEDWAMNNGKVEIVDAVVVPS